MDLKQNKSNVEAEKIPAAPTTGVSQEYFNLSKVANALSTHSGFVGDSSTGVGNTIRLSTIPKKDIFVTVDLLADPRVSLSNRDVTPFDLTVMDAVYTMFVNGIDSFTPEMVIRIMTGNMEQNATKQKIDAVVSSLLKLSMIRLKIDCTDEFVARKLIAKGDRMIMGDMLLPIRDVTLVSRNGIEKNGYRLKEKPILYEYAEQIHQIASVPITLLEPPKGLSNTDEVVVLRQYLIKRIEGMKSKHNGVKSNRIAYKWKKPHEKEYHGLYADLGYKEENYSNWRKKKANIHRAVVTILGAFKEKDYISDFQVVKNGQEIKGVDILFDED